MPVGLVRFEVVAHAAPLADASWALAVKVATYFAPLANTSWALRVCSCRTWRAIGCCQLALAAEA
jgi:hypothetical protein